MRWKTERTDEFGQWWEALTDLEQSEVLTSIEVLEEVGPGTGRPTVDSVKGSRHRDCHSPGIEGEEDADGSGRT